jgi:hypothetical protein
MTTIPECECAKIGDNALTSATVEPAYEDILWPYLIGSIEALFWSWASTSRGRAISKEVSLQSDFLVNVSIILIESLV